MSCARERAQKMFKRLSEQDHYQVLEVAYGATPEQVQAAYDTAREIYQSESLVSSSILTADERRGIFQRITEAYHTLIAEESRRLYDQALLTRSDSVELKEILDSRSTRPASVRSKPLPVSAQSFPRLVKPASASSPPRQATVHLSLREEASGAFLRQARESAGLDLRSIAAETKIGVTLLGYIEEERLDRLPAPVYLRSFVAQFARCLGLEEERVARSYLNRIKRLQTKT